MLALVVAVRGDDVDLASDALWGLGVRAIEERATPNGGTELWTSVGEDPAAVARALAVLRGRWATRTVEVDTEAADTWREHAQPMPVDDDLVIVPAWWTDDMGDVRTVVRIEPAGAFGLGDHPTTLLALRATTRLLAERPQIVDVIDVGCGTGVIAIVVALRRPAQVRAVDVAGAAVEATRDNARRNGVAARIIADGAPLADVHGDYDLVVANILAPTLIALAPELRRATRADGRLVVSGILADRHDHVVEALAPMEVERTDVLDGWAAVTLRHP